MHACMSGANILSYTKTCIAHRMLFVLGSPLEREKPSMTGAVVAAAAAAAQSCASRKLKREDVDE